MDEVCASSPALEAGQRRRRKNFTSKDTNAVREGVSDRLTTTRHDLGVADLGDGWSLATNEHKRVLGLSLEAGVCVPKVMGS